MPHPLGFLDTCGYVPRVVRASAELLADAVEHYTFVSTISVYAHFRAPRMDESATVGTLEDETVEEVTGETYGPLKALCEQAVEAALPTSSPWTASSARTSARVRCASTRPRVSPRRIGRRWSEPSREGCFAPFTDAAPECRCRRGQLNGGFSIDASVHIEGEDRAGLERLVRYCARPPLALERLHTPAGFASLGSPEAKLIYRLPEPDLNGRTVLVLTPPELIARSRLHGGREGDTRLRSGVHLGPDGPRACPPHFKSPYISTRSIPSSSVRRPRT